jgi:hypothetical protein
MLYGGIELLAHDKLDARICGGGSALCSDRRVGGLARRRAAGERDDEKEHSHGAAERSALEFHSPGLRIASHPCMRLAALPILFALALFGCGESDAPNVVVLPDAEPSPDARGDTGSGTIDTAPPGCPPGQSECSGRCVVVMSDPMNCGGCGTICLSGSTCSSGMCMLPSPTT